MYNTQNVSIEIKDVWKSYGNNVVLHNASLAVNPGETLCIIGRSGQGKSVLLRLIIGLEDVDEGTILLNGIDVKQYREMHFQRKPFRVAMVFQSSALINSLTVFENIALHPREHKLAKYSDLYELVRTCLRHVDLEQAINLYPVELSGGMKKRVAIARALASLPNVMLFDEPTAELDPVLCNDVAYLIKAIKTKRHMTQIIVTHNLVFARQIANRIALLEKGKIACIVTPDSLLETDNASLMSFIGASGLQG